jgi:hypothetical protein
MKRLPEIGGLLTTGLSLTLDKMLSVTSKNFPGAICKSFSSYVWLAMFQQTCMSVVSYDVWPHCITLAMNPDISVGCIAEVVCVGAVCWRTSETGPEQSIADFLVHITRKLLNELLLSQFHYKVPDV